MTTPMLYVLYAFIAGAASAFAFEPVGWWPLLLVAFAVLCELIDRSKTISRTLLIGWAFGLGQFVVGLNWIATAFTYQAAMPAWLGWVAVVLLSLYLAVYPALAAGLAWRFGRDDRLALVLVLGGAWAITEWLRGTMFTGFPWNPAAAALAPTPLIKVTPLIGTYGLSGLVVLLGGAVWLEYYRRWLPLVMILGATVLLWVLPSSPVPPDPLTIVECADRPAQYRPAGQVAAGLRPGGRAAARPLSGPPSDVAAAAVLAGGRGHRSARGRPNRRAQALAPFQRDARGVAARARRPASDRRNRGHLAATESTSTAPRTAFTRSAKADRSSAATTRRTSCPTANICRCGLCSRRSVSPASRPAISTSRRARGRARSTSAALGQGRFPALLRDHLLRPCRRRAATAPVSSSTRRTTRGSEAGARRSISPRPAFARPRKAFPCFARHRPASAR